VLFNSLLDGLLLAYASQNIYLATRSVQKTFRPEWSFVRQTVLGLCGLHELGLTSSNACSRKGRFFYYDIKFP